MEPPCRRGSARGEFGIMQYINRTIERIGQRNARAFSGVRSIAFLAIFFISVIAGWAQGTAPSPQAPTAAIDLVHLTPDGCFPKQLTVKPGRNLLWVNKATALLNFLLTLSLTAP